MGVGSRRKFLVRISGVGGGGHVRIFLHALSIVPADNWADFSRILSKTLDSEASPFVPHLARAASSPRLVSKTCNLQEVGGPEGVATQKTSD